MMKGCSNCIANLPPAHATAAVLVTTPKLSSTSNMSQIHSVFSFNHHHPHHHVTSSTMQAAGRCCYSSNKQQQQPAAASAAVAPARSSRWNPTPEQIMVLEDLYRSGIKTPTAQQIRLVTARLRHYGRIEGKNVFYWFQNHRARERQKKRRELMSMHHHHQSGDTTTKQERQTLTTVNAISRLPLGGLLQQADKKSAGSGVDFVGRLEEVEQQQNKWTLQNCCTVISDQESSSVLKERLMRSMGNNSSRNNILVKQSADDTLNYTKGDLDVFHHCYDHCNDAAAAVLTIAPAPKKEEEEEEEKEEEVEEQVVIQVEEEDEESTVAHQTLELFPLKSENLKDTQLAATTVDATADFLAASDRYFLFL